MKKKYLIIVSSVLGIFLLSLPTVWFLGKFYITKFVKENELLNVEKLTIAGFPLSYKINIENATISNKSSDNFVFKKAAIDLNLFSKKLYLKNIDDIIVNTTINNQLTSRYHTCEKPTTIEFNYKSYFWYKSSKPQIKEISYNNKNCKILNQDKQELLRIDESTANLNVNAKEILFSIHAEGFKDRISNDIKIGDFKLDLKGELIGLDNSKPNQKEDQANTLIVLNNSKLGNIKILANLDSALAINSNMVANYQDEGYEVNADITVSPVESIIDDIVQDYHLSKEVITKIIELVSVKEGNATKFTIKLNNKEGLLVGSQAFQDLAKKYFYLQQSHNK